MCTCESSVESLEVVMHGRLDFQDLVHLSAVEIPLGVEPAAADDIVATLR